MTSKVVLALMTSFFFGSAFQLSHAQDALTKEAQALVETAYSGRIVKCSDSWFWSPNGKDSKYLIVHQAKNLKLFFKAKALSEADRLNGTQWSGDYYMSWTSRRLFNAFGKWEPWTNSSWTKILEVTKRNGKWTTVDSSEWRGYGLAPFSCSEAQRLPQ